MQSEQIDTRRPRIPVSAALVLLALAADARAQEIAPGLRPRAGRWQTPGSVLGQSEPGVAFGQLQRRIPIKLPPARGDLVPYLALEYTSSSAQSLLGTGWQLPLDHVRHARRFGPPTEHEIAHAPDAVRLEFRLGSASGDLVYIGKRGSDLLFRPRRDTVFAKLYYSISNDAWTVLTRDGLKRWLGARDREPGSRGWVHGWFVKTIRDRLGNEICYEYRPGHQSCDPAGRDHGRLQLIEYNRRYQNPAAHRVTRVLFAWESGTRRNASYFRGWRQMLDDRRLARITVQSHDGQAIREPVRYVVSHADATASRQNLSRVQVQLDPTGSLPPTDFGYGEGPRQHDRARVLADATTTLDASAPYWDDTSYGDEQYNLELDIQHAGSSFRTSNKLVKLIDWDADGDLDQLLVRTQITHPNLGKNDYRWYVRVNSGAELLAPRQLAVPTHALPTTLENTRQQQAEAYTFKRILDMNADGRPDIVIGGEGATPAETRRIKVCLARENGTGWDPCKVWFQHPSRSAALRAEVRSSASSTPPYKTFVDLLDITGDGYPDYVMIDQVNPGVAHIYPGSAKGISATPLSDGAGYGGVHWPLCPGKEACLGLRQVHDDNPSDIETRVALVDVNRDGIVDLLRKNETTGQLEVVYGRGDGSYIGPERPAVVLGPGDISRDKGPIQTAGLWDMDGDGLLDRVEGPFTSGRCGSQPQLQVWLNRGSEVGWKQSPLTCWKLPDDHQRCGNRYGLGYALRALDAHMVKDHYPDHPSGVIHVALFNALLDLDGDGQLEWVRSARDHHAVKWTGDRGRARPLSESAVADTPWCAFEVSADPAGLMRRVRTGAGVEETYEFERLDARAPVPIRGLRAVRRRDHNLGAPFDRSAVLFEHGRGRYDVESRRFCGLDRVTEIHDQSRSIERHFHQGPFDAGLPFLVTLRDGQKPHPLVSVTTQWELKDLDTPARKWPRAERVARVYFDPATGKALAHRVVRLAYHDGEQLLVGLPRHVEHQGGEQGRFDHFRFEVQDTDQDYIVRLSERSRAGNAAGNNPVARTRYHYDSACSNTGGMTVYFGLDRGLLCRQVVQRGSGTVDAVTRYAYDPSWHSLRTITDPDGVVTTLDPTPEHRALQAVSQGGLRVTLHDIHPLTGEVGRICGPQQVGRSLRCSRSVRDSWGRLTAAYVPQLSPGGGFIEALAAEISYRPEGGDPARPPKSTVRLYPAAGVSAADIQVHTLYEDGRGQPMLEEHSMPGGLWAKRYYRHDRWGRLAHAWHPVTEAHAGPHPWPAAAPDFVLQHDALDRLREVVHQGAIVRRVAFGANKATITGAGRRTTEVTFSPFGEVLSSSALDGTTPLLQYQYRYNLLGLLREVWQPQTGERYTYSYYDDGTLRQVDLPGTPSWTYNRRPGGAVESITAASGAQVVYAFDSLGRLATRTTISPPSRCRAPGSDRHDVYTYAPSGQDAGRLVSVAHGTELESRYGYNARGLLAAHQLTHNPSGKNLKQGYEYNLLGQLTRLVQPGRTLELDIGVHGLPERILSGASTLANIQYTPDLQLDRTWGSLAPLSPGLTTSFDRRYDYDSFRRLERIRSKIDGQSWNVAQSYDRDHNLQTRTDDYSLESHTIFYDAAGRIESGWDFSASGPAEYRFRYKQNGALDRVELPGPGTNEVYVHDQQSHRLARIDDGAGKPLVSYGWGADGQLCSRTENGQTESYRWSADGRLAVLARNGTDLARLIHGESGERLAEINRAGEVTLFVGGLRKNLATGEVHESLMLPGVRCEIPSGDAGRTRCHWYDGQNVALVSDGRGVITHQQHYSPFGRRTQTSIYPPARYGYNGQAAPADGSPLLDYGLRHYDPRGRIFASPDPLAIAGLVSLAPTEVHPYSYAGQNPTTYVDMLGLTPERPDAGVPQSGPLSTSALDAGPSPGPASMASATGPGDASIGHPANVTLPPGVSASDVTFASCAAGPELCANVAGFHEKEAAYWGKNAMYLGAGYLALGIGGAALGGASTAAAVGSWFLRLGPVAWMIRRFGPAVGRTNQWAGSLGAAKWTPRTLQTGGNTIRSATANALNKIAGVSLKPREWGRALESLKNTNGLKPGHHGKILENGDYLDDVGNIVDNILGYLP